LVKETAFIKLLQTLECQSLYL